MEKFEAIDVVEYDKGEEHDYGIIAEELEKIYPELVVYRDGIIEGVMYEKLCLPLIQKVQKQEKEIEELKKDVQALARALILLEKRLEIMEEK